MQFDTKRLQTDVEWFLTRSACQVAGRFLGLPGAVRQAVPGYAEPNVLVMPTRPDYLVFVAHSDTVFDDHPRHAEPVLRGDVWSSGIAGRGLGADDRAGCALLWQLRKSGHALLIPAGEERGCAGSTEILSSLEFMDVLVRSRALVQFDRRGANDVAIYDNASKSLADRFASDFGHEVCWGSVTDVAILGPAAERPAVNFSAGFLNEHSGREVLHFSAWVRALLVGLALADSPPDKMPYEHRPRRSWVGPQGWPRKFDLLDDWDDADDDVDEYQDDDYQEAVYCDLCGAVRVLEHLEQDEDGLLLCEGCRLANHPYEKVRTS